MSDWLDSDQVIPDNIIININDWVLVSCEGFQVKVPILLVVILR